MYDFDEWSRAHYGEMFQRKARARQRWEAQQAKQEQTAQDLKSEKLLMTLFTLVCVGMIITCMQDDLDKPK